MRRRLSREEESKIANLLSEQLGVTEFLSELVLMPSGRRKIRAVTPEAFDLASRMKGVVNVGLYVAKIPNNEVALSMEGSQLLTSGIKRGIIELTREEAIRWMVGAPIERNVEGLPRFVVAKFGDVYLGSGRTSRDGKIYPQIPKWRRIPE